MAGEERPFKRRTTHSTAADEAVTGQKGPFLKPCTTIHLSAKEAVAGEECPLKGCQHVPMEMGFSKAGQLRTLKPCNTKRKAEEAAAGEECPLKTCTTKRKTEASAIGRSEEEEPGYAAAAAVADSEKAAAAAANGEQAPGKKMTRMPQEEVEWILAHVVDDSAPYYYEDLKRQNPDLRPSPEEEKDESRVIFYTAARAHYAAGERFLELQTWVRSEYEKYGYVEVDDDFVASRAQVQAWSDEARAKAFANITFSDSDDD